MWKVQTALAKGKFSYVGPSGADFWPQNLNPSHENSCQNVTPALPFSSSSLECSSKTSKPTQSQYNGNWIWATGHQPTARVSVSVRVSVCVRLSIWGSIKSSTEAKKFNNDRNSHFQGDIMSTYYAPCPVLSSPFSALPYLMIRALWCEYHSHSQQLNSTDIKWLA